MSVDYDCVLAEIRKRMDGFEEIIEAYSDFPIVAAEIHNDIAHVIEVIQSEHLAYIEKLNRVKMKCEALKEAALKLSRNKLLKK